MKKLNPSKFSLIKFERFIKTKEDWYPSYKPLTYGNPFNHEAIRISFFEFPDHSGYRVCAWGDDDFGLEYDFSNVDLKKAQALFNKINKNYITQKEMRDLGMYSA